MRILDHYLLQKTVWVPNRGQRARLYWYRLYHSIPSPSSPGHLHEVGLPYRQWCVQFWPLGNLYQLLLPVSLHGRQKRTAGTNARMKSHHWRILPLEQKGQRSIELPTWLGLELISIGFCWWLAMLKRPGVLMPPHWRCTFQQFQGYVPLIGNCGMTAWVHMSGWNWCNSHRSAPVAWLQNSSCWVDGPERGQFFQRQEPSDSRCKVWVEELAPNRHCVWS